MTALGAWIYPWDIADHGASSLADDLAGAAIDVVHVATSYHSLFATLPDNPARRFVELTESALYLRPDPELWSSSRLQPTVSPLVEEVGDARLLAGELAEAAGCQTSAWTVVLHDTGLGRRHPASAVQTVWGRPVLAAPCLRDPLVRDYARRLIQQVTCAAPSGAPSFRPVDEIQLESPSWTLLPHHRHARSLAPDQDLQNRIAELCFCARCSRAAGDHGVDVDGLAHSLRELWRTGHDTAGQGFTWALDHLRDLQAFLDVRTEAVTSLVTELISASSVPVELISFGDRARAGIALDAVEAAGAQIRVLMYGTADQVGQALETESQSTDRPQRLSVGLSLLPEHVENPVGLRDTTKVVLARGVAAISLYHIGLVDAERRGWTRAVAETIANRP